MKNKLLEHAFVITGIISVVLLIVFGYLITGNLHWTGFIDSPKEDEVIPGKTLWDWLDLLIIPLVLAFGAWFLKRADSLREHEIEEKREQDAALHKYLDSMENLLLDNDRPLQKSEAGSPQQDMAFMRTLAVLRQLDEARRSLVFIFLRQARLLGIKLVDSSGADYSDPVALFFFRTFYGLDMSGAYLPEANLSQSNLIKANLSKADLRGTILKGAHMNEAILRGANLSQAKLISTHLEGADLSGANLFEADLTGAYLGEADLRSANFVEYKDLPTDHAANADTFDNLKTAKSLKGAKLDNSVREWLIREGIEL